MSLQLCLDVEARTFHPYRNQQTFVAKLCRGIEKFSFLICAFTSAFYENELDVVHLFSLISFSLLGIVF